MNHKHPASGKKERHLRSGIKAITWRILATLVTTLISYFVTGSVHAALSIGTTELFFKLLLYYVHERLWQRIPFY